MFDVILYALLLWTLAMAGFFLLGMFVGRTMAMTPMKESDEPVTPQPKWQPGNLMDPIGYSDQITSTQKARDQFARFKEDS